MRHAPHVVPDLLKPLVLRNQEPRTRNQEPRTKNQEPRTKNQEPGTKNQEPRTRNQEPRKHQEPSTRNQALGTKHQEPGTKNQEPRTKNQEPKTRDFWAKIDPSFPPPDFAAPHCSPGGEESLSISPQSIFVSTLTLLEGDTPGTEGSLC